MFRYHHGIRYPPKNQNWGRWSDARLKACHRPDAACVCVTDRRPAPCVHRTSCYAIFGGKPFSRGALYLILQNRLYRGEIVHKGQSYPGEHTPIIDQPERSAGLRNPSRRNGASGGQPHAAMACQSAASTRRYSLPSVSAAPADHASRGNREEPARLARSTAAHLAYHSDTLVISGRELGAPSTATVVMPQAPSCEMSRFV